MLVASKPSGFGLSCLGLLCGNPELLRVLNVTFQPSPSWRRRGARRPSQKAPCLKPEAGLCVAPGYPKPGSSLALGGLSAG